MIELHSFSALLSKDILKDFKFFNQFGPTYKIRNEFLLDILTIMQEKFHISDKDVKLTANAVAGSANLGFKFISKNSKYTICMTEVDYILGMATFAFDDTKYIINLTHYYTDPTGLDKFYEVIKAMLTPIGDR